MADSPFDTPSPDTLRDHAVRKLFGFDLAEDAWLQRVKAARAEPTLGRFGSYQLLEVIGRGGQGLVYRARQPRTGREVALKRLSAGAFATPEMRARFDREIEAAAALHHPNIITVYGSEIIEEQPILTMQWIDGVPFDRWACPTDSPRREVREVLQAFLKACDAISHAHRRGVIHRDLKPSNILIDRQDEPHVLDFGLAKIQSAAIESGAMTQTGDVLGTPAFAAPEQLLGDHRNIDVRTDIYALGAVLFQALTGRTVVDTAQPILRLIESARNRVLAIPSSCDPRLDRELDAILLKSLATDIEQRFGSVDAFADDIRRYLNGEAVTAHPPSTVYRIRKFARQHWLSVSGVVALLAFMISATAISTSLYFSAERERNRANDSLQKESQLLAETRKQEQRATREAGKATAATKLLTTMLTRASRATPGGNPNLTVRELLEAASDELRSGNTPYDPEVEGNAHITLADSFVDLGLDKPAEEHYMKAIELARQMWGEIHNDVAVPMEKLSRIYRRRGDLAQAEEMLTGVLRIRTAVISDPYDGYFALTYNALGLLQRAQRKFDEAELSYRRALAIYLKMFGPDNENIGINLGNLGSIAIARGRPQDAVPLCSEGLDILTRFHGTELNNDINLLKSNLASALAEVGRMPEAEALLRSVVEISRQMSPEGNTWSAIHGDRLASVLMKMGKYDDALANERDSAAIARSSGPPNETIRILANYADHLANLGRMDEAEKVILDALAAARGVRVTNQSFAPGLAMLGLVLLKVGCYAEAEQYLSTTEPVLNQMGGDMRGAAFRACNALVALYTEWNAIDPDPRKQSELTRWQYRQAQYAAERPQSDAGNLRQFP